MSVVKGKRKVRIGLVVSDKMNKTRVVRVERFAQHPRVMKTVKKFENFKVHDEKNLTKVGNKVKIMETRPLSKDKRWRIIEIIESKKEQ